MKEKNKDESWMSVQDLIDRLKTLDPKARVLFCEGSDDEEDDDGNLKFSRIFHWIEAYYKNTNCKDVIIYGNGSQEEIESDDQLSRELDFEED
jgi:hypothetical protein